MSNNIFITKADARAALIEGPLALTAPGGDLFLSIDYHYDLDTIAEHCLYRAEGGWTADWEAVKREAENHRYRYTGKFTFIPVEGDDYTLDIVAELEGGALNLGRVKLSNTAPHPAKCVSGLLDGLEWPSDLNMYISIKILVSDLSQH